MNSNVLTEQQVVEFGPVKKEIRQTLMQLKAAEQTEQVRGAIGLLEQAIADFDNFCQPTMVIPISHR
jgi:hypothetical protein